MKPCLVLNKIDRLITDLHLTPEEAFQKIQKILEQVNAVVGTLYSEEWLKQVNEDRVTLAEEDQQVLEGDVLDDTDVYFSPEKGNVIFASSLDGWGFRKAAQLFFFLFFLKST